jgi:hypothetical protein
MRGSDRLGMSAPFPCFEALARVPGPRKLWARRHPVTSIFPLAVLGMLTGCRSYEAIARFGCDKGLALAHALGYPPRQDPLRIYLLLPLPRLG